MLRICECYVLKNEIRLGILRKSLPWIIQWVPNAMTSVLLRDMQIEISQTHTEENSLWIWRLRLERWVYKPKNSRTVINEIPEKAWGWTCWILDIWPPEQIRKWMSFALKCHIRGHLLYTLESNTTSHDFRG